MLPYLALMSLAVLPGLAPGKRPVGAGFVLVGLAFVLFIGFRWQVGPDWTGYENLRRVTAAKAYGEVLAAGEPGFFALLKLSHDVGWGIVGINVLSALVFCFGVFALARRTPAPWLALCVATSYLVPALGMSGIRQAMSLGIVFWALSRVGSASAVAYVGSVAAAMTFHFSAVLMLPLIAFQNRAELLKRAVVVAAGGAALGFVLLVPDNPIDVYLARYTEGGQGVRATGAIFHVLLNAVPAALYLATRKAWERVYGPTPLITAFAVGAIAMFAVLPLSTVGASRLSMYLTAGSMLIWAGLPRVIGGRAGERDWRALALLLNGAVMLAWLTFANVAAAYFPYRSVLVGL